MLEIDQIAAVVHEMNREYRAQIGEDPGPSWPDAPNETQVSICQGIEGIRDGRLRTPRGSHESWRERKHAGGWKYGKVKDPEKKEHPCMLPYDQLPEEQRMKDSLFLAVVSTLLGN